MLNKLIKAIFGIKDGDISVSLSPSVSVRPTVDLTQQSLDKGDKITSNTLTITEEELENASYTSSTIESEGK